MSDADRFAVMAMAHELCDYRCDRPGCPAQPCGHYVITEENEDGKSYYCVHCDEPFSKTEADEIMSGEDPQADFDRNEMRSLV